MCLLFAAWINRQLEKAAYANADYAPTLFMAWTPVFPQPAPQLSGPGSQTLTGRTEQHLPAPGLIFLDDATGTPVNFLQ